jgi:hypothetical protein
MFGFRRMPLVRVLLLAVLITLPAATAYADAPTFETVAINQPPIPIPACSFPVLLQFAGELRITKENGAPRMVHIQLRGTFTNPASGKSLAFRTNLTRTDIVFNGDGTATVTDSGLGTMVNIPGVGNVGATVGRARVTIPASPPSQALGPPAGPPISFEYQHGQFDPLFPAACQYLQ